jgi:tyrosyl-tRNA synthetase
MKRESLVSELLKRKDIKAQWDLISRGVVDLLPEDEFLEKVRRSIDENRPLRVKQGFDPTAPDIHLGHTVGMRKLKQFQDLGHTVVLIVGDYTSLVGDPSGRSATRPMLTYEEIMRNAETYQDQFFRILDKSKTEVRFNGEWFKQMDFRAIMHLAGQYTVARLLERDDYAQRMQNQTPISIHELFYPLMQAYDSVAIEADVELGATEQRFNLLAGRVIQQAYGKEPQCVLTLPILVGLDGEKKMSKSLGNYIGITESPRDIFGKIMSIPDNLIYSYFELTTDCTISELAEIKAQLEDLQTNPMAIKKQLGERLVDMYHGAGDGRRAREEFERVFSKKELPDDMPELSADALRALEIDPARIYLVHLMSRADLTKSNGEARKLIQSGAVTLDGEKVSDPDFEFALAAPEMILKVGKRRFLRLKQA